MKNIFTYKGSIYILLHRNYRRREGIFWRAIEAIGITKYKWKVTVKYADQQTDNVYERSEKTFFGKFRYKLEVGNEG